jgi:glyoxylase-like metal-dependent hydrolase (beta-lactamase superfamily II)
MIPTPSHDIFTIETGYTRHQHTASYLLKQDGHAAFIEVATSHSVPRLLAALEQHGMTPAQVEYVIVTHVHLDHAGAAGTLMQHFPNATLIVHPRGAPHLIDPSKLIAGAAAVYGGMAELQRLYGEILPVPGERVIAAPDNFTLDWRGRRLRFLDTPGHARHHFVVVDEASRSIFSGDNFGLSYREFDTAAGAFAFPTTTPVQFEPDAMHQTLDRIMAEQPRQVFLTHYGAVTEIERLGRELHELVDEYVSLTQAVADLPADQRYKALSQSMENSLLQRLRRHGCTLSDERCRELLAMDIDLNTQGLLVWLERASKPKN